MAAGALYFVPAYFLSRYANKIGQFLETGSVLLAEEAREAQKSFWKFVGILTVIALGVYLALFLMLMVAASSHR